MTKATDLSKLLSTANGLSTVADVEAVVFTNKP